MNKFGRGLLRALPWILVIGALVFILELQSHNAKVDIDVQVEVERPEISREPAQVVRLTVANNEEESHELKLDCMDLGRLSAEVQGPGSMDEPISLEPGESRTVEVKIDGTTMGDTIVDNVVSLRCLIRTEDEEGELWKLIQTFTFTVVELSKE